MEGICVGGPRAGLEEWEDMQAPIKGGGGGFLEGTGSRAQVIGFRRELKVACP